MNILIVYDSYFGNTQEIAETIYNEIKNGNTIKLIKASEVEKSDHLDKDLIIIGSPTRAFSPTKQITNFTKSIPKSINAKFAVFDTRMQVDEIGNGFLSFLSGTLGYANDTLEKILKRKGIKSNTCNFYVSQSEGPLLNKETEKAKDFAKSLV